jgi:hypothetical protein
MNIDTTTMLPSSACVECGHIVTACNGDGRPSPGDFSLCIRCTSLSVFDEDLKLRYPTTDEFLAAAADEDVQHMRRVLLFVNEQVQP